jgi:hypothetical protein
MVRQVSEVRNLDDSTKQMGLTSPHIVLCVAPKVGDSSGASMILDPKVLPAANALAAADLMATVGESGYRKRRAENGSLQAPSGNQRFSGAILNGLVAQY